MRKSRIVSMVGRACVPTNAVWLGLCILVIAVVNSVWYGALHETWVSPDAACYLRMARNILAGNGMNPDGLAGVRDGWFAVWPIGYPAFLAGMMALVPMGAVLASKVGAVVITALILLVFAKRFSCAFPVLAVSLLNPAFLKIFRSTWSEQLFILFLLLASVALADLFTAVRNPIRSSITLGLAMVGLFLSRYIGLFFVAPVAVFCMIQYGAHVRQKSSAGLAVRIFSACGASALTVAAAAGYLAMNVAQTGHMTGMPRAGETECLVVLWRGLCALVREGQAAMFLVLVAAPGVALVTRTNHALFRCCRRGEFVPLAMACLCAGACYLATVLVLRCMTQFDEFGYRLLYPGTFLLMTAGITLLANSFRVDTLGVFNALPQGRVVVYLLLLLVAGPHFLQAEYMVRSELGLPAPKAKPAIGRVETSVLKHFQGLPPGSVVLVEDYLSDSYFATFMRPDLMIYPLHLGKYGERLRFPSFESKLFMERTVVVSETENRAVNGPNGGQNSSFVENPRQSRSP